MSLFSTFATNRDAENNGIWLRDFPKNDDGTTPAFRLARKSKTNTAYAKAAERIGKKFRREIQLDILSEDKADPALRELFVETCLLDWENVYDKEGKPIPFSKENALKLFELLPDLYLYLDEEAGKLSNFRSEELKADAGN